MKKILIIDTGGTFNKVYNPLNGTLEVLTNADALKNISKHWLCDLNIHNIIGKDSLDITNMDRMELLSLIVNSEYTHIIVVHGTDTMSFTAEYLADAELDKVIILTGAMVPFSISPIEATANLTSAYGYIQALDNAGVYIAMNGCFGDYMEIIKDRDMGRFVFGKF